MGREVNDIKNKVLQFNAKGKETGKMEIKNATTEKAELYFYGDIVSAEWEKWDDADTCPDDVCSFLKEVEDVKELNIYINSGGGSVFAGMAIYNMLKRFKGYKTVYVDGLAGSIASVIAFAGDKIVMPSNAYMVIHKPWGFMSGNATEIRKQADSLDKIEQGILNVYQEHMKEGADFEKIKEMVDAETWLTGQDAAEYFNIEVAESVKAVACTSDYFSKYEKVPKCLEKVEDKQTETKNKTEKEMLLMELEII